MLWLEMPVVLASTTDSANSFGLLNPCHVDVTHSLLAGFVCLAICIGLFQEIPNPLPHPINLLSTQ